MLSSMLGRKQTGLTHFREKIDSGEAPIADATEPIIPSTPRGADE